MSEASRKAGRSRRRQPQAKQLAPDFYGELLTEEETNRLEGSVSLDDELRLLRSRVYRLAGGLDGEGGDDLKTIQSLVLMIRAIATLERAKLTGRGQESELSQGFLRALRGLDPYKQL